MIDVEALKVRLANAEFKALSDRDAAIALVSPTIPYLTPVPSKRVAKYLDMKGKLPRIQMYANASVPVDIETTDPRGAAMVMAAIGLSNAITMYDDFDLSDPDVKKVAIDRLTAITQTGLIDQDDVDAIVAMADGGMRSIAEVIGCDDLMAMDRRSQVIAVARAREAMSGG